MLLITVTWQRALCEGSLSSQRPFELCYAQNNVSQLHPQEVTSPGAGGPRALQHRLDTRRRKIKRRWKKHCCHITWKSLITFSSFLIQIIKYKWSFFLFQIPSTTCSYIHLLNKSLNKKRLNTVRISFIHFQLNISKWWYKLILNEFFIKGINCSGVRSTVTLNIRAGEGKALQLLVAKSRSTVSVCS